MGKFTTEEEIQKNMLNMPYEFDVIFRKNKRVHTETFQLKNYSHMRIATINGLMTQNDNGYYDYLDWKPLGGPGQVEGGIKEVYKITRDKNYIYAHTTEKIYSLPRYLESKIPRYDYILFGKRVSYNYDSKDKKKE